MHRAVQRMLAAVFCCLGVPTVVAIYVCWRLWTHIAHSCITLLGSFNSSSYTYLLQLVLRGALLPGPQSDFLRYAHSSSTAVTTANRCKATVCAKVLLAPFGSSHSCVYCMHVVHNVTLLWSQSPFCQCRSHQNHTLQLRWPGTLWQHSVGWMSAPGAWNMTVPFVN